MIIYFLPDLTHGHFPSLQGLDCIRFSIRFFVRSILLSFNFVCLTLIAKVCSRVVLFKRGLWYFMLYYMNDPFIVNKLHGNSKLRATYKSIQIKDYAFVFVYIHLF